MIKCPSQSCHVHLTELRQSAYAYSVTIAIAVYTTQAKHIFPDFCLTTVKFPDFSGFYRSVATLIALLVALLCLWGKNIPRRLLRKLSFSLRI